MSIQPTESKTIDRMLVHILESNEQVGQSAAEHFSRLITRIARERGRVAVILATGNSQLTFMSALRLNQEIPWDKVTIFHMDEYLGMSSQHPVSFACYIREKLVNIVHPAAFYPICGDASDTDAELKRYASLLREFPPDVCVLGIGENGHLAFNDPPADFDTQDVIHVVTLDERCRLQQVHEGHFPALEYVPRRAITLTVPALLAVKYVLAVVPEARKAPAVKAALLGPVTPDCPASILRTKQHVTMYLDRESASLLK
jgi:glucosamine-6-phosphate deaminase